MRNLPDDLLGNLLGNLLSNLLRNIAQDLLGILLCDLLSHLHQAVTFLTCIRPVRLSHCAHNTRRSALPAGHASYFPHNLKLVALTPFLLPACAARDTNIT